jgi:hypothetical protein
MILKMQPAAQFETSLTTRISHLGDRESIELPVKGKVGEEKRRNKVTVVHESKCKSSQRLGGLLYKMTLGPYVGANSK